MVWGCITSYGVGRLHRIHGIMNAQMYCNILETSLLGTLSDHGMSSHCFFFQQDNDRKHTSRLADHWFHLYNIKTLPWPSSSPDMNIIERVWDILEKKVRRRPILPTSEDTLWKAIKDEWYKIPPSKIQHLYESMPRRVMALNEAKSKWTKY